MKVTHKSLMIAFALMIVSFPVVADSFTGHLVHVGGISPGIGPTRFALQLDEFSTDEEVQKLATTLTEEGSRALQREMHALDLGWLRIDGSVAVPVAVARSIDVEGGRIVRVLIDRPISFFEVWNRPRIADYPMTILEIQVDEEGRGQGTLIAAAQLEINEEGSLEVESLGGWQSFRLRNVRERTES